MSFEKIEEILLIVIVASTLLMYFLHKICGNRTDKFSKIINRAWDEWFEQQSNAILGFLLVMFIIVIIGIMFRQ